jgi:hypothetical protein
MLFGETVPVYCANHTEHTDALREELNVGGGGGAVVCHFLSVPSQFIHCTPFQLQPK